MVETFTNLDGNLSCSKIYSRYEMKSTLESVGDERLAVQGFDQEHWLPHRVAQKTYRATMEYWCLPEEPADGFLNSQELASGQRRCGDQKGSD